MSGATVLIPPYRSCHQWRLANSDWMPESYTSGQPSYLRRHPTCWTSSQWSHTVSSTLCHEARTPAPLSAHPSIECKCMAPKSRTCLYPPHDNSSVHLTTKTYVRHTRRITIGMWSGWTTPQAPPFSSPTPAPNTRNGPLKNSLGPA